MSIDFNSTVKGSLLEGFYPKGWDMAKIDECCSHAPEEITEKQKLYAISPLTGISFACIIGSNLIFRKAMMGKSSGILRRTESWVS